MNLERALWVLSLVTCFIFNDLPVSPRSLTLHSAFRKLCTLLNSECTFEQAQGKTCDE